MTKIKKPSPKLLIPVLVTTSYRGVFFGYIAKNDVTSDPLRVKRCRNVLYWSADVKGFLGLASSGPTSGCRVGPEAVEVLLHGITSVTTVTEYATRAFLTMPPWKQS